MLKSWAWHCWSTVGATLLCWFYYILGQAHDTFSWCFFPSLCVPTCGAEASSFQTSLSLQYATACWHLMRSSEPPTSSRGDDSGRVTSLQPRWFTHGRRSCHVSCEGHLIYCSAVDSHLERVLYNSCRHQTGRWLMWDERRDVDLLTFPLLYISPERLVTPYSSSILKDDTSLRASLLLVNSCWAFCMNVWRVISLFSHRIKSLLLLCCKCE